MLQGEVEPVESLHHRPARETSDRWSPEGHLHLGHPVGDPHQVGQDLFDVMTSCPCSVTSIDIHPYVNKTHAGLWL